MNDVARQHDRPSARRRPAVAGILCALGLIAAAPAAEVSLRVSSRTAYLDEPLTLEVEVRDFQQCETPQIPPSDDYDVRAIGAPAESTFVSIVNGRRNISHSRSYTFELTPRRTGRLTIGPAEVLVDGRRQRSNTVEVVVRRGDRPIELEITTDAKRLFVGQQARFVLTLRIRPVEVAGVPLGGGQMYSFLDPRHVGLGPFPAPRTFSRIRRPAPDGTTQLWYEYTMEGEIVVDRVGPLHFDDLEQTVRYPTRLSRDLFGDLRAEGYRLIRLRPVVKVPPVEPLPEQGRPPLFNGAVGRFEILAHASPTRVHVGDPIELVIELTGEGPLATLAGPDLTAQPRLTRDFRVPDEPLAGKIVGRRKRFTQTIRAKRADVQEIPPIEYAYFDPQAAEYRIARSLPIPIKVMPADRVSSADIEGLADVRAAAPDTLEQRAGMHEIRTDPDTLLAAAPAITPTLVGWSLAAPPLAVGAFAVVLGMRRHAGLRRRPSARRAAARALGELSRLGDGDHLPERVHAVLLSYLAERLAMPAGRRTVPDVLDALRARGLDPGLLEQTRSLLEQCEQAKYGAGPADGTLAEAAAALIQRLEHQRW